MMTKKKESAEKAIRDIRRATRRQYSAEEKIRIVLEGLRGESSIAELCRKEGINQNLYYRWSKEFLEAGKKRLAGDTAREANSNEVKGLRREAAQLKEALAETVLKNRLLKKSTYGAGGDDTCDTKPQRNARSSIWWNAPHYRFGAPWIGWVFPNRPFTAGTSVTAKAAMPPWRIPAPAVVRPGTACQRRFANRS
jgi:transposase